MAGTLYTVNSIQTEAPCAWELAAHSERGQRRENQDNYLLIDGKGHCQYLEDEKQRTTNVKHWPAGHVRLVMADGMGGHENGRQIAEALVQALMPVPFLVTAKEMRTTIMAIHERLFRRFCLGPRTPGATLVLADIDPQGRAVIANVGDSRGLLYRQDKWIQLTKDHTVKEFAWRDGDIPLEDYLTCLKQPTNRIAQAMGFGSSGIIPEKDGYKPRRHIEKLRLDLAGTNKNGQEHWNDVFEWQLMDGEVLLLASDGLWQHCPDNDSGLKAIHSHDSLSTYVRRIADHALFSASTDNISVIAAQVCLQTNDTGEKA